MNLKTRRGTSAAWLAAFALVAAAATYEARPTARSVSPEPPAAQDLIGLDRRIGQLEQRFNTMDLRISRLEQQSRIPTPAPSATSGRDTELQLLRSEVELLRQRVAEDECGLVRLDERTLTDAAREARRKAGATREDPCRLTTDAPLRLSSRQ